MTISRIALGVEYDGSAYHGFARQPARHGATVQGELEDALSRIAAGPIRTICAGRTDAGVHATGQVVHFDSPVHRPERAWVHGTNTHLPDSIRVRWAAQVAADFHARFTARARRYLYLMHERVGTVAIGRSLVTPVRPGLDVGAMSQAALEFLGTRDFSAVRGAGCQARHPVRTIQSIELCRTGGLLVLDVSANAFLLHMVRNIAGMLLAVGEGALAPSDVRGLLAGRDRTAAPATAAPRACTSWRFATHRAATCREAPLPFGFDPVDVPGT